MGSERRRYERRGWKEEVYCYLDGQRVNVQSTDISAGGMFIETHQSILPGTEVAVVVKAQLADGQRPVFLTARVMRRQVQPVKGVGIRWEKATSPGDPHSLRKFLQNTLRVDANRIDEHPHGDAGLVQSVFQFPLTSADLDEAPRVEVAAPLLGGGEDTIEGLDDEEATIQELGEDLKAELSERPSEIGPLTTELGKGDSQAPADLKANLIVGRKEHPVRVSSLGPGNAFVATNSALEAGQKVELRFSIVARGGSADIRARAEVISLGRDHRSGRRGGLVKLTRVDEGSHPGIFRQYTRWLHFNAIRNPTV